MSPRPTPRQISIPMPILTEVLLVLYSLLTALLLVLGAPWWLGQTVRTGKYREGWRERLGRIPVRLRGRPRDSRPAAPDSRTAIWVHAVSVGEVLGASRLIDALGRALPGAVVYVSTTTRTGQALARERFGADRVCYFPLDFAFTIRAWLRFLKPAMVVLVESEFWPRMLIECARASIPVAVVNARVSDRSWPRYQRLRRLWRPLLGSLGLVLAQSEQDAQRLRALGAPSAKAAGNLKYDIRVTEQAPATAELRARLAPGVRVVVCGSTLAGEEALLLDALPLNELVTILAPRHPERFDAVARLLADRQIPSVRRSSWRGDLRDRSEALGPRKLGPGTVVLLDSVGELASVYSLATLAVVGGGFLWPGGHNPLEPAQFGVPVLMGAGYANFRDVVETLLAQKAVAIADASGLKAKLVELLEDTSGGLGEGARQVFEEQAGATDRTLAALLALIARTPAMVRTGSSTEPGAAGPRMESPEADRAATVKPKGIIR